MAEPKERILEENDKILYDFRNDIKNMERLRGTCEIILKGRNDMNVLLLKVNETNARSNVSFTNANCDVVGYRKEDNFPVSYTIGTIFSDGITTLQKYLMENKLPDEKKVRKALAKLLSFISLSQDSIKPKKQNQSDCEWSAQLAQHLLSQLSVDSKFTLGHHYSEEAVKSANGELICPCGRNDLIEDGDFGDTSFGCPGGWHGSVDIMLEDMSIKVTDTLDFSQGRQQLSESSEDGSQSSVEVKTEEKFSSSDNDQLLAQCIVFSFLQRNQQNKLGNSLTPSLGISANGVIASFYDCENDILLQTRDLPLFTCNCPDLYTVVFLWLTLNYRCFCSGITDSMKIYKADFFERVGDLLPRYKEDTKRPAGRISDLRENEENWSRLAGMLEIKPTVKTFTAHKRLKLEAHNNYI